MEGVSNAFKCGPTVDDMTSHSFHKIISYYISFHLNFGQDVTFHLDCCRLIKYTTINLLIIKNRREVKMPMNYYQHDKNPFTNNHSLGIGNGLAISFG